MKTSAGVGTYGVLNPGNELFVTGGMVVTSSTGGMVVTLSSVLPDTKTATTATTATTARMRATPKTTFMVMSVPFVPPVSVPAVPMSICQLVPASEVPETVILKKGRRRITKSYKLVKKHLITLFEVNSLDTDWSVLVIIREALSSLSP